MFSCPELKLSASFYLQMMMTNFLPMIAIAFFISSCGFPIDIETTINNWPIFILYESAAPFMFVFLFRGTTTGERFYWTQSQRFGSKSFTSAESGLWNILVMTVMTPTERMSQLKIIQNWVIFLLHSLSVNSVIWVFQFQFLANFTKIALVSHIVKLQ